MMLLHERLRELAVRMEGEDQALVLAAADALEPNEVPKFYWGKVSGPLHALKPGQSHLFEGRTTREMCGHIWQATKRTGWQFRSRTVTRGCRVWRIT